MSATMKACVVLCLAVSLGVAEARAMADHDRDKDKKKSFDPVDHPTLQGPVRRGLPFVYQPELLPARSWEAILAKPGDHFGESLDIGPADLTSSAAS